MTLKLCLAVLLLLAIQGCETTNGPQYYWGDYERLIYTMYNEPGKAPPRVQIEKLTRDIDRAESRGRVVAPGIYAHLGYMYAAEGNIGRAESAFQNEMRLYPESRIMLEGMVNRARKVNQAEGQQ